MADILNKAFGFTPGTHKIKTEFAPMRIKIKRDEI